MVTLKLFELQLICSNEKFLTIQAGEYLNHLNVVTDFIDLYATVLQQVFLILSTFSEWRFCWWNNPETKELASQENLEMTREQLSKLFDEEVEVKKKGFQI